MKQAKQLFQAYALYYRTEAELGRMTDWPLDRNNNVSPLIALQQGPISVPHAQQPASYHVADLAAY